MATPGMTLSKWKRVRNRISARFTKVAYTKAA
jgi:hypothetical protein